MRGFASRLRAERTLLPRPLPFVPLLLRSLLPRESAPPPPRPLPSYDPRPAAGLEPGRPLTVFTAIRNGVENGYPFVEAYGSWARYAERIVVVDGESSDGTDRVLESLRMLVPQLEVVSRPWPAASERGSAIAVLTNEALGLAADGTSRLMYVQADEIYPEEQRALVRGWEDGAVEFSGCVNFWNSLDRVLENDFPMRYVRLLPAGARATSVGDGYTFEVEGADVRTVPERFLHYGWCFPVNILRKHVSHARIYRDSPAYRARGFLARRMLDAGVSDPRLLDALAPHYRAVPFRGEHPACMRHLAGATAYDPRLGLEQLAAGARW